MKIQLHKFFVHLIPEKTNLMKQPAFLFLILICFQQNVFSQYLNIKISSLNSPEEPTIAINPLNQNELVAGSNMNLYYYSNDGGLTWTQGFLHSDYGVYGDPCIVADKTGNFYFFHLSDPSDGNWIDRIVCQKSTDQGKTWNNGSYMGLNGKKAQDKQWVTVDFSDNTLYSTWTQFDKYGTANSAYRSNILFSKSTDSGESWSDAVQINHDSGNCFDSDSTMEGAVPAVGPNGEVYVAWAGAEKIFFTQSTDKGKTWPEQNLVVADQPGGWDFDVPGISRCNGLPITCCDTSDNSSTHGNIYINWTDQRNGINNTDVWMIKSTNGGNSWTAPKRVNQDTTATHQFFTWMTIDQTNGNLFLIYYDRRNYSDDMTDVYLAVSKDGGASFVETKISESPFTPDRDVFFGDYTNITAYNNVVRPIWTRFDMKLSIWTAIVDGSVVDIKNQSVFSLTDESVYPNPTQDISHFSFKLHQTSRVSLSLINVYGETVKQLITNEIRSQGIYIETLNPRHENLSPGTYFYSLICDKQRKIKKLIVF